MSLRTEVVLTSFQPMVLVHIVNHPAKMIHVFALVSCIVCSHVQVFVAWLGRYNNVEANTHAQYIPDIIKAVSHLLIGLVEVVCDAVMSATTTMVQLIVPTMHKNDENG